MRTRKGIAVGVLAAVAVLAALWGTGARRQPEASTADAGAADASEGPQPVEPDPPPAADEEEDAPGLATASPRPAEGRHVFPAGDPRNAAGSPDGRPPPVGLAGSVVTADGKPAGRVEVIASGYRHEVRAIADADGKFRLETEAGRWDLVFRSTTDGALLVRGFVVDGSAPGAPFRLGGGSEIRVEVRRGGEPVAGAAVEARLAYGDRGDGVAHGTTDAAGVFTADAVPAGPYRVEVWPEGEPEYFVGEHGLTPPPLAMTRAVEVAGRAVVAFELPATVRVTGRVTDATSHAGVNALVEVVVALEGATVTGFTRSENDGAYEVQVPAGRVRSFRVDDYRDHAPFPAPADEKALFEALGPLRTGKSVVKDVVLVAGSRLSGTVTTGPERTPVEGLWLRFEDRQGHVLRTAPTNVMGGYLVLALPAGEAIVTLDREGWFLAGSGRRTVTLPAPAEGTETTLDLEVVPSGVVSGVVVGADGAPVPGATVRALGGGLAARDARRVGRVLETISDAGGRFSVTEVPPNVDVRLEAALGDARSTPSGAFRLPAGDPSPVRLVLAATGRISGRVVDLVTRASIPGARVRVAAVGEPAGRVGRRLDTDADGCFEAGGFVPGTWRLTPDAPRGGWLPGAPREVEVRADGRDVILDLALDPGRAVAGTVLDEAGAPVAGARVALTGTPDGAGAKPLDRRTTTGADGRFRIAGLESGTYALRASRRGSLASDLRGLRGGEERLIVRLAAAPGAGK